MTTTTKFAIYWRDGREEYLFGATIEEALESAGYVPKECRINFITDCGEMIPATTEDKPRHIIDTDDRTDATETIGELRMMVRESLASSEAVRKDVGSIIRHMNAHCI